MTDMTVQDIFDTKIKGLVEGNPAAKSVNAVVLFKVEGAGNWYLNLRDNPGVFQGDPPAKPDCTVSASPDVLVGLFSKKINAMAAYTTGKLKVDNLGVGMKLIQILKI